MTEDEKFHVAAESRTVPALVFTIPHETASGVWANAKILAPRVGGPAVPAQDRGGL
jgi:hypothetical protein